MNEVDCIFDAAIKAGKYIHLMNRRQEKVAQIRSCEMKTCGHCGRWMKTTCLPEKKHKQFKSMNSPACGGFELSPNTAYLIDKFKSELGEIDASIKQFLIAARMGVKGD